MYSVYSVFEPEQVKQAYEERLRNAAEARLAQEFLASQPKFQHRLRELLGNFMINFGMRLKMPYQSKFA